MRPRATAAVPRAPRAPRHRPGRARRSRPRAPEPSRRGPLMLEQPFRTSLAGVDADIVVLRGAVRWWSRTRRFQPPLSPLQIRDLGEHAAAAALATAGARSGERWRVIVSESVVARRIGADGMAVARPSESQPARSGARAPTRRRAPAGATPP